MVKIFVHSGRDKSIYQDELTKRGGPFSQFATSLVIGAQRGLGNQRNFILKHASSKGHPTIFMDDDVQDILMKDAQGELQSLPRGQLWRLIQTGFVKALECGATLWGVAPTERGNLLRRGAVSTQLGLCTGPFFGVIPSKVAFDTQRLRTCLPWGLAEDIERTLRHFDADGVIVRLYGYSVRSAPHGRTKGGLQSSFSPCSSQPNGTTTEGPWKYLSPKRAEALLHVLAALEEEFPHLLVVDPAKPLGCEFMR